MLAGVPTAIENSPIMPPEKSRMSARYRFWKKLAGAMKMLPMKATAATRASRRRLRRGGRDVRSTWATANRRVSGRRRVRSSATTHQTAAITIDVAPSALADVGESERHHGHAGTEPGCHGQDADGVRAAVAWHLLGGDHADQERQRDPHRPGEGLGRDERDEARRERAEQREQWAEPGDRHDHASSADSVGDDRRGKRDQDPGAYDSTCDSDAGVADTEVVRGEVDRLGEERVDERSAHRCSGEQTDDQQLGRIEAIRWRPPAAVRPGAGEDTSHRERNSQPNHGIVTAYRVDSTSSPVSGSEETVRS